MVGQHYPEEHHLQLRRRVHVELLCLHSLLEADSYSASSSIQSVSPGPVSVATYFAERWLHLSVQPGLCHHNCTCTVS